MLEELPAIPTLNTVRITTVNKRVKRFSIDASNNDIDWMNIELTAKDPIVD